MAGQSVLVLILLVLGGVFAVFNAELLAQNMTARMFPFVYEGPMLGIFLLVAAAALALHLAIGGLNEWNWRRRLRVLTADLAVKDREIVQLKAAAYVDATTRR